MWFGIGAEELQNNAMADFGLFLRDRKLCPEMCNDSIAAGNGTVMDVFREAGFIAAVAEFRDSLFSHDELHSVILLVLYLPVFSIAFVGNILVLAVVVSNRTMRNVTNFLLVNLAAADLSVSLVCVPIAVGERVYKAWVFGAFMCKFSTFLQGTAVACSIFTISLLSLDRFLAIKKPMVARRLSSRKSSVLRVILVIWVVAAAPMIPLFMFRQVDVISITDKHVFSFCRESWLTPLHRLYYDICICALVYIIPGAVIITSYSLIGRKLWHEDEDLHREDSEVGRGISRRVMTKRKRIARMLFAVAILFSLCWLPYYIICLYLDVATLNSFRGTPADVSHATSTLPYTILIGHANSAINPVIYFYANRSFRRSVLKLFPCKCSKTRHSPRQTAVKYSPGRRVYSTGETYRRSYAQILSGSRRSRTRSTGSFRLSRSTNNSFKSSRSFRSSGSLRRKDSASKTTIKPALTKLREAEKQDSKAAVPEIKVDQSVATGIADDIKHRRDIFSFRLSIPTTINEESRSSRATSPMVLNKAIPSTIQEDEGGDQTDLSLHFLFDSYKTTISLTEKQKSEPPNGSEMTANLHVPATEEGHCAAEAGVNRPLPGFKISMETPVEVQKIETTPTAVFAPMEIVRTTPIAYL